MGGAVWSSSCSQQQDEVLSIAVVGGKCHAAVSQTNRCELRQSNRGVLEAWMSPSPPVRGRNGRAECPQTIIACLTSIHISIIMLTISSVEAHNIRLPTQLGVMLKDVVLTTEKFMTLMIHTVSARLTIIVTNSSRRKKYRHLFLQPYRPTG